MAEQENNDSRYPTRQFEQNTIEPDNPDPINRVVAALSIVVAVGGPLAFGAIFLFGSIRGGISANEIPFMIGGAILILIGLYRFRTR